MATSFEQGNKTSRFIKDGTFHDLMTDYQILKQKSAALSYLAEIFLLGDSRKRRIRHYIHLASENSQSSA